MLGHKSATMTLDLYGHLFPDRLDTVAEAMDAARAVALEASTQAGTGRRRDTATVLPLNRWSERPPALRFRRPGAFLAGDPDGTRTRGLRRDRAAR